MRSLTERLPVLICPRWVSTLAQPVAIDEVVFYLLTAIDLVRDDGALQAFPIRPRPVRRAMADAAAATAP